MSEIIFYTNPQSRGRIISWMLEELGEPYQTEWISYGEQIKSAAYREINPMGKVPAVKHNGAVITEAPAICTYLALQYPEKKLIPAKGDLRLADFTRWMFFAAAPLEMAIATKTMNWPVTSENARSLGFGTFDDVVNALELAVSKGPFVCGDQFTAVDVYLGFALFWGMQFNVIPERPALAEYVTRLMARPAAIRATEINDQQAASQSGSQPDSQPASKPA